MVKQNIGTSASISPSFTPHPCSAAQMGCSQRKNLSVHAIRRTEPITRLAQKHKVSRKFVYQQLAKATVAIDQAFEPAEPKDEKVLFYLPITKTWIHQFVLSLILICHSSFRGVLDILDAMFDYHDMSLGTVHNIVQQAVVSARRVNDSQDLSGIRIGDHDEIYQANRPVLVGMDHRSTYCYLLAVEDSCDETTWGVHLLDLSDHGLYLERTIADGGNALRAGQRAAWGDAVPCDGDVFHAQMRLTQLLGFVGVLDDRLVDVAERFNIELYLVHGICELQGWDKRQPAYWQRRAQLRQTLGKLYYWIETAVIEAVSDIPRASSLVENLNSRLRNYFFLRRHISNDYLDLLRFFFNHHRYARSDRPERVGKSPAELLSGSSHGHWLELLGFERFRRN